MTTYITVPKLIGVQDLRKSEIVIRITAETKPMCIMHIARKLRGIERYS